MIETLIGLADKLPSVEARRGLIVSIMQDTVATITSREVGSIISSSADLLTYLTQCLGDSDKLAVLSNFKQAINSFVGKIGHPYSFSRVFYRYACCYVQELVGRSLRPPYRRTIGRTNR